MAKINYKKIAKQVLESRPIRKWVASFIVDGRYSHEVISIFEFGNMPRTIPKKYRKYFQHPLRKLAEEANSYDNYRDLMDNLFEESRKDPTIECLGSHAGLDALVSCLIERSLK